jgi:hypothetical protein
MTPSLKPAYLKKVDERGDIAVWIVDGADIRPALMKIYQLRQYYRFK